jgi:hypothetical protein
MHKVGRKGERLRVAREERKEKKMRGRETEI